MGNAVFIGIDPGVSGGLSCVGVDGPNGHVAALRMPDNDADLLKWLRGHRAGLAGDTFAALEKVGGYVGGDGQPGSRMFSFGVSFGTCRMALAAVGVQPFLVQANVWQRALGIAPRRKGEVRHAFKARLKLVAQELFAGIKVTLYTADSLLLSEYCRRKVRGLLPERRLVGRKRKVV